MPRLTVGLSRARSVPALLTFLAVIVGSGCSGPPSSAERVGVENRCDDALEVSIAPPGVDQPTDVWMLVAEGDLINAGTVRDDSFSLLIRRPGAEVGHAYEVSVPALIRVTDGPVDRLMQLSGELCLG